MLVVFILITDELDRIEIGSLEHFT